MTGGGAGTLAYVHEPTGDNYAASPTDSDYKTFGRDHTVTDLSLDNALAELRDSTSAQLVEAIKTTFEGAFSVEFALGNPWFLNHVFGGPPTESGGGPYDYQWTPKTGRCQSARVYAGVDYLDGTAERELKGVVFPEMQLSWSRDAPPTVSLTGFYASEEQDTSLTPGSTPNEQQATYSPSALTLQVPDSNTIAKLADLTLTIAPNTRPQRGTDPEPKEAVIGAWETTLSASSIVTDTSLLSEAYGGSSATSPQRRLDGVTDASVDFAGPSSEAFDVALGELTPSTHSWDEIGNPENDITESVEFTVGDVSVTATSSEASAR